MKHSTSWISRVTAVAVVVGFVQAAWSAAPVSNAFTYQGRLEDGGSPVDGPIDFSFRLFDAAVGGNSMSILLSKDDIVVSNGLFSVDLDFGPSPYLGTALWLEIRVRPGASTGAFTILARQALQSTPFAQYALNTAGVGTLDQAYDFGGPGAGRIITADNGPVQVSGNDGLVVSGNIGAGTFAPQFKIEASGSYTLLGPVGETTIGARRRALVIGTTIEHWLYMAAGSPNTFTRNYNSQLAFRMEDSAGTGIVEQMRLTNTGNLGIGTIAPSTRLHVEGGTDAQPDNTGGFLTLGSLAGANVVLDNNEIMARNNNAASTLFVNHNGGHIAMAAGTGAQNVGIGSQNPTSKLHVIATTSSVAMNVVNFGTGGGALITQIGGSTPALTLNKTGTGVALDVGGITRTQVVEITGADLAEKFPVSEETTPGTVMEIDPQNAGKLRIARGAYNRRVAGIVSGANNLPAGAILGNLPGHEDAPPIALSGRVWVKCNNAGGGIELGDLLTTSEQAGTAMKVNDFSRAQGSIIGKAMTSLSDAEGFVLVLVSLQ